MDDPILDYKLKTLQYVAKRIYSPEEDYHAGPESGCDCDEEKDGD